MPLEERVYRMRCVEGWSMVIPWSGFPLAKLLERVEPMGGVEYVAFETLLDPKRMPGQKGDVLPWPYVEGLRMDEAMHPLTILAVGLYGHELPAQNGAPIRLVVPWKYGFKGIKSIVKITLQSTRPATTWNMSCARPSTGSSPTLTPRSTTRDGVRRPSNGSASRVVGRRSCSTAMARRWPISIRVWTCGQTSEAGGKNEGHSIRQIHRTPQLRRPGHPPRLGCLEGPARRQPGQLRHPDDRASLAHIPGPDTRWSRLRVESPGGAGWASSVGCMGLYAFFHACLHFLIFFGFDRGASASGTLSEIIKRPYLMVGTLGLVLMVPLAVTSTDGMIRRLGGKRWKALHRLAYVVAVAGVVHYYMLVKADVTQPVAFAVVLAVLLGYRLIAHYVQLRSAYYKLRVGPRHSAYARRQRQADGEAKVLVGPTEGRAGLRRDARGTHVPPRPARGAPGCRSTSCLASI